MRQEGLSNLSEKLDEGFEKYVKSLTMDMLTSRETLLIMENNINRFEDQNNKTLNNMLDVFHSGVTLSEVGGIDKLSTDIDSINSTYTNVLTETLGNGFIDLQNTFNNAINTYNDEQAARDLARLQAFNQFATDHSTDEVNDDSILKWIKDFNTKYETATVTITDSIKAVATTITPEGNLVGALDADRTEFWNTIQGYSKGRDENLNSEIETLTGKVAKAVEDMNKEDAVIPEKLDGLVTETKNVNTTIGNLSIPQPKDYSTSLGTIISHLASIDKYDKEGVKDPTDPNAFSNEDKVNRDTGTGRSDVYNNSNNGSTGGYIRRDSQGGVTINDESRILSSQEIAQGYVMDNGTKWNLPEVGKTIYGGSSSGGSYKTPSGIAPAETVKTNTSTSGKTYSVEIKDGKYWVNLGGNSKRLISSNEFKAGFMLIDGIKYDVKQAKIMATKTIKPRGYAKGTLNASPGLAQINERNMLETLLTKNATYVPFEGGEGVVPAKQTRAIVDFANSLLRKNSSTDDLSRLLELQNSLIAEEQQLSQYIARNQSNQTAEETRAMLDELDNLRSEVAYTEMIASDIHSAFESNLDQNDTAISYFNALNESNAEQNYLIDLMSDINQRLQTAQINNQKEEVRILQEEFIRLQDRIQDLATENAANLREITSTIQNEVINKIDWSAGETTNATDNVQFTIVDLMKELNKVTDGENLIKAIEGMSSGKFGNIDLNDRHVLEWTEENKEKYRGAIDPSLMGEYSTVLGGWQDFSRNGQDFSLAYSPMLQTANGARLLDADTMVDYLNTIIDKTLAKYGTIDLEKILEQDRQGARVMDNMTNTIIRVHDMIAGFSDAVTPGNAADLISHLMHSYDADEMESGIDMIVDTISNQFQEANIPDLKSDVDEADLYNLLASILGHDTAMNMSLSELYERVTNNASDNISNSIREGSDEIQTREILLTEDLTDTIHTTEEVLYDNLEDNFSNLSRETARNGQAIIEMRKTTADFAKKNVEILSELMGKIIELEEANPEQSGEILLTDDGTLLPSSWTTSLLSEALLKLQDAMSELINAQGFLLQLPDMSAYQTSERNNNISNNTSNEIYIDSLITINGDATQDTVDKIKDIATQLVQNKQFQENVTNIVSKRQAQDRKMSGARTYIK